jgi:hypothetical protein
MEIDPNAPPSCLDPAEIDYICQQASRTPPGAFLEIGVYKGGLAYYLAKVARLQKRQLYLFDTFTGTPHQCQLDTVEAGSFSDTSVDAVQAAIPDAICIPGIFPTESAIETGPIAFVHLDVDQYEAYRDILPWLAPRMARPGGMIWLADMLVYKGAAVAIREFMQANPGTCGNLQVRHAMLVYS